jgi:hypothetical protein
MTHHDVERDPVARGSLVPPDAEGGQHVHTGLQ